LSTPGNLHAKSSACDAADLELVRLLAVLAKSSFTHEEDSQRTVEACHAFKTALEARVQETGAPLVLANRSDGLYTASGKVQGDAVRDWLRGALQRALLGALVVHGSASTASLHQFFTKLRTNNVGRIRKDATFDALWPDRFDGLDLHELRFYGGYVPGPDAADAAKSLLPAAGGSGGDAHAALLRLGPSEAQIERIRRLELRLAAIGGPPEHGGGTTLSDEMFSALPADVVDDPAARTAFLDRLLDRFEESLDAPVPSATAVPSALGSLVDLFRRAPPMPAGSASEDAIPPQPASRPEDRGVDLDDPEALAERIAALPEAPGRIVFDEAALHAETLAVCLHHLGADTTSRVAEPAAARLRRIVESGAPRALEVLERYVRRAAAGSSGSLPAVEVERTLLHLERHRLLPALRREGGLSVERVVRRFPEGFVLFLRTLAEASPADRDALVRVLTSLKDAALAAGLPRLLEQREILDPVLLRKLFALGGRSALFLARGVLRSRDRAVQEEIVAWLRATVVREVESEPLDLLDASALPPVYLDVLLERERTGRSNARLRGLACELLYAVAAKPAEDDAALAAKIRAITALVAFPGPSTQAVLEREFAGSGGSGGSGGPAGSSPFASSRAKKEIRQTIQAVRARWKEEGRV
jgi:hypothetical protein